MPSRTGERPAGSGTPQAGPHAGDAPARSAAEDLARALGNDAMGGALARTAATGARAFRTSVPTLARNGRTAAPLDPAVVQGVRDAEVFRRGGVREQKGFTPGPGGGFDAKYDPRSGRLTITVKAGIIYRDGLDDAGNVGDPGLANVVTRMNAIPAGPRRRAFVRKFKWTAAEKRPWRQNLESTVERMWTARHQFHVFKPGWEWIGATPCVNIKVSEHKGGARPADMHVLVTAVKVPNDLDIAAGEGVGSVVSDPDFVNPNTPRAQSAFNATATIGSQDVRGRRDNLLRETVLFDNEGDTAPNATEAAKVATFAGRFQGATGAAARPSNVTVTAHASASGSAAANRRIAQQRADAVRALLATGGFTNVATRVTTVNRGAADAGGSTAPRTRRVDLSAGDGRAQVVAAHEFGHVFGLDDEYDTGFGGPRAAGGRVDHDPQAQRIIGPDGRPMPGAVAEDNDNIMSVGNNVRPQHYSTFIEALTAITSQGPWQVGPPRRKPTIPRGAGAAPAPAPAPAPAGATP